MIATPADLKSLTTLVGCGRALLALDVGAKTIGIAICDRSWLIASPLTTIRRSKFTDDAAILVKLVAERDIAALVIGYPIDMSGTPGKRCQSVRQFAKNLAEFIAVPMVFQDERLSTQVVEKAMIAADMSRRRRDAVIDQSAATYILQNALEGVRCNALPR